MGYEVDGVTKVKCPCGKSFVSKISKSNDWMQVKEDIYIECEECSSRYNIEFQTAISSGDSIKIYYLVPKGKTLKRNSTYNIKEIPFEEQLSRSHSLEELKNSMDVLNQSTTYSKIEDEITRKIMRRCRRVKGTIRMETVREYVRESLKIYDDLEINYDKDTSRISKVMKKSIKLINI